MRKLIAAALVAAMLGAPAVAAAGQGTARPPQETQQSQSSAAQQATPAQPPAAAERPDPPSPEALGISIDRVRRELRELPPVTTNLLRYDFHVDVYGTNPTVDIFKGFDLSPNGPVRYGGMTHAEFLDVVTPQAYRAPSANLMGLAAWAISQLAKKKADSGSDRQDK